MAAKMIPSLGLDQIEDRGERRVFAALRDQLPSNWTVRYHYTYCLRDGLYIRDGEADFIIVAPGKGVLFLEVKQSHGYDCRNGVWYRLGRDGSEEATDNPFDQASKNKFRIVDGILCRALGLPTGRFPGIYGHAVVYPFGKVQGKLPPSQDPVVMIAYRDMEQLSVRLLRAFADWGSSAQAGRFTDAVAAKVVQILAGDSRFVAVAASSVDDDDAQIEQLTRDQYGVFRGVLANTRVRIEGRAGSGKTQLALWAAQAFASGGKKVLFLCFNRVLAQWLKTKYHLSDRVTLRTFHSLCREFAERASIPFQPPQDDPEESKIFWAEKSASILDQALGQLGDSAKYDVIIVDEAQDFHQDWWLPIQLLLHDVSLGPLYLFGDSDQSGIYGQGHAYPADINCRFELVENCRNTRHVAKYCSNVIERPLACFELAPLGVVPEVLDPMSRPSDRAGCVKRTVQGWLDEGFRPSRIAVVSPWRRGNPNSTLTHLAAVAGFPIDDELAKIERWMEGKSVWGSTIKAFKGLEADCLLVTDVPTIDTTGFSRSDMYVAASRAKHRLVFAPVSEDTQAEIKRWISTKLH